MIRAYLAGGVAGAIAALVLGGASVAYVMPGDQSWAPGPIGYGCASSSAPDTSALGRGAAVGVALRETAQDPAGSVAGLAQGVAARLGRAYGGFTQGLRTGEQPVVPPPAPPDPTQQVSTAASCCPSSAVPAASGLTGPALAADAILAAGATRDEAVRFVAVAAPESGYDPRAANPSSSARGMWQIMVSAHADKIAGRDVLDPYVNADVAVKVLHEAQAWGDGWSAWSAYGSRGYYAALPGAELAVDEALARRGGTSAQQVAYSTTPAAASCSGGGTQQVANGTPPSGTQVDLVIARARALLGVPYVWGGDDPDTGIDCSRLTELAYEAAGVDLPPVSWEQVKVGTSVPFLAAALPGDLIFWGQPTTTHVALYVGDGTIIEAPRPGLRVQEVPLWGEPSFIRRVLGTGASA